MSERDDEEMMKELRTMKRFVMWAVVVIALFAGMLKACGQPDVFSPGAARPANVKIVSGSGSGVLSAAKTTATSGQTIVVGPGLYADNDLLKDGVNWFFYPGAVVSNASPQGASGTRGIWEDKNQAVTSTIGGYGSFFYESLMDELSPGTLVVSNSASNISITCKEIGYEHYYTNTVQNAGTRAAVCVMNAKRITIKADRIFNKKNTTFDTGVLDEFDQEILASCDGNGIYWQLGDTYVTCPIIESNTTYSAWSDQPSGNTTAANFYLTCDLVDGHIYASGHNGTSAWKNWYICKDVRDGFSLFGPGKNYIFAEKILASAFHCLDCNGPTEVWVNCQKFTSSVGRWIVMVNNGGAPTVHANVLQYEDNGAISSANAGIEVSAGELHVDGGYLVATNGVVIKHSGGSTRVSNATIKSTGNNAANHAVVTAGAGLILDRCTIIAPALADSVNASSAQTITAYNPKANKAKNANVTVNVDAITADANVQ